MSVPLPQSAVIGLAELHRRNAEQLEADRRARGQTMALANRRAFAAECEAAGVPATSTISPSLHRMLTGSEPVDTDAEIPEAAE